MKKIISLSLLIVGILMIGIGIGGCISEDISSTACGMHDSEWERRRVNHDLVEVVDPETGVHYLLHDTGSTRGGSSITVMYDSNGRIKCDE